MRGLILTGLVLMAPLIGGFVISSSSFVVKRVNGVSKSGSGPLSAFMDPITYSRVEFVSASIVSNQIPRAADSCLQINTIDPRVFYYVPKTLRKVLCHPTFDKDDKVVDFRARRQIKQAIERRGGMESLDIEFLEKEMPLDYSRAFSVVDDESVDVVLCVTALEDTPDDFDLKAMSMEIGRVLKPGGRFIFVEREEKKVGETIEALRMDGSYRPFDDKDSEEEAAYQAELEGGDVDFSLYSMFDVVEDPIDMCPMPFIAGVSVKRDPNEALEPEKPKVLTPAEQARAKKVSDGADLVISAFERGRKKSRPKKKGGKGGKSEGTEQDVLSDTDEGRQSANPIDKLRNMVVGDESK